jgi:hypothetical protein
MDEVEKIITATVDKNGGRTSWNTVRDSLDYRQQQLMPQAIKSLKKKGIIQAQNRVEDGKPVFEVFRIGTPIPAVS